MKKFPFKTLKNILEEFDTTFSRINWGGCGIMASILAYHLKDVVDDLRIVSVGGHADCIDEARKYVRGDDVDAWDEVGVSNVHVWVEFKWRFRWYAIDAEGLRSRREMYRNWGTPPKGSLRLNEIRRMCAGGGWNWAFDRDQVPKMKKLASKRFKLLKEI